MEPFGDSVLHVLAELERVDLLIRAQVTRARQLHQADEEFQGLYIPEEEVDALLAEPVGMPRWATATGPAAAPEVAAALERLAGEIAARRDESVRRGVHLRLDDLRRRFTLSPFELDVLLVALAPEIDLRYERLFAYLQDDVTKRRPSVDLALNLLCPDLGSKLAARASFHDRAPLLRHRLVELFEDPSRPHSPLLGKYLKADERIVAYLFDSDALDHRLLPFARSSSHILPHTEERSTAWEELVQPEDLRRRLRSLAGGAGDGATGRVVYLQGAQGVGKESSAEAVCGELGLGLVAVDLERLATVSDDELVPLVELAGREAVLGGAALFWRGFDRLLTEDAAPRRTLFLERLAERRGLSFLAGEAVWEPSGALCGLDFLRLEFPLPTHGERVELWSRALLDGAAPGARPDLEALATKFRFTGGQVRDAAATAASLARRRASANDGRVSSEDLYEACRLHSNRKLSELAQKIVPHYRWGDVVLPEDRLDQLREIVNCVRYRARVYEDWGFGDKLSLGKGLNVLFAGPSGTGKTMAAEILASELGLDLYKIDLSTVVSKYIGETEKNLSRIFKEAETSNAILFFDEADALFGKRSEVRDSHDRYANVEISYLLQKMEEFEGVAILATNLKKNMDDAFVRRMHFSVDFPFPDEKSRRRIWEGMWPRRTPRSPELDLGLLARRFEIAGGSIKNIAVAASFLAAADGGVVAMPHLLRATRREYQKMGKVMAPGEFGRPASGWSRSEGRPDDV